MNENILELKQIRKQFGELSVLNGIDLGVKRGEFLSILGPSGCGKTTLLRVISGLCTPDSGAVYLNGEEVTKLPPNRRNVNTIFQNYALFPHMNVEANIAYGLKIKGVKKQPQKEKVAEMLRLVQLEGCEKKMPSELSGGQKQRVAIARALVNDPQILLLDEPLGALDLQLRRYLQTELKRIQKALGITFIYITHDQEEAMNLSDRIVVMSERGFEQTGTPQEVYDRPETAFVAQFIGTTNLIYAEALSGNRVQIEGCVCPIETDKVLQSGERLMLSVRSERLRLDKEQKEGTFPATVLDSTYANGILKTRVETREGKILISIQQEARCTAGETVYVGFSPQYAVVVEGDLS